MPEKRLEKTRATLPAGYQFGDAALFPVPLWAGRKRHREVDAFGVSQWEKMRETRDRQAREVRLREEDERESRV